MSSTVVEVLGWTSVIFYIGVLVFNNFKHVRIMSYASAVNDVIFGLLIGVLPKVLLNLVIGGVNSYRYAQDYTKASRLTVRIIAVAMLIGILYFAYFAITSFLADPNLGMALNWLDFVILLTALSITNLRGFQWLMLLSAFVGGASYYLLAIEQMIVVKCIVGGIAAYKLFVFPYFPELEKKIIFWKN